MKTIILDYILKNTVRDSLDELSTKQISSYFNISTKKAYLLCNELSNEGLITKLDPVNGNNFDCCGWIRNED